MKKAVKNYWAIFVIAAVIVALDQWTKWLVRTNIPAGESWLPDSLQWLSPYARIVHWYNRGAAFGMFQQGNMVFTVLAFIVIAAIIYYYPQISSVDWPLRLAMSMQMGGAIGNLIDRLTIGHVTDFISVGKFPVFNIADSSISVGCVVLLLGVWWQERAGEEGKNAGRLRQINQAKQPVNDRVLNFRFDKKTPERLDKFLVGLLQEFSRSRIQGLIADGFVDVNGQPAKKAGQTLESGSNVTVRIPPPVPTDLIAEDIPLDIVFENDDLIVVNKPAGMVVHPAAGHSSGTLVNADVGI